MGYRVMVVCDRCGDEYCFRENRTISRTRALNLLRARDWKVCRKDDQWRWLCPACKKQEGKKK